MMLMSLDYSEYVVVRSPPRLQHGTFRKLDTFQPSGGLQSKADWIFIAEKRDTPSPIIPWKLFIVDQMLAKWKKLQKKRVFSLREMHWWARWDNGPVNTPTSCRRSISRHRRRRTEMTWNCQKCPFWLEPPSSFHQFDSTRLPLV